MKPNKLAQSAVTSAISSIELFNRPEKSDRISLSVIANVRAWEQIGKAFLVKKKRNILYSNEKSFPAEKIANILFYEFKVLDIGSFETIHQLIALRNEFMHMDLNEVPDDLAAHLLYFSLKTFREFTKKNFKGISTNLNANFISVNFQQTYTYGARIKKILAKSKGSLVKNRLLYVLEKGLYYSKHEKEMSTSEWLQKTKNLKRKRITKSALYLKEYASERDSVFFITVTAPGGYGKAEVSLSKGHQAQPRIIIADSNPEQTHPYLTKDLSQQLGIGMQRIATAVKDLGLKGNPKYHLAIRTGNVSSSNKYSEEAKKVLKVHFETKIN